MRASSDAERLSVYVLETYLTAFGLKRLAISIESSLSNAIVSGNALLINTKYPMGFILGNLYYDITSFVSGMLAKKNRKIKVFSKKSKK